MPIVGNYLHVHLLSQDPRGTAEWYAEFLGGEIMSDRDLRGFRNVQVKLGECLLNIRGKRPEDTVGPPKTGMRYGIDHMCFRVTGIDEMLSEFAAKGGEIPEPLFELPNGNRGAYIAGPEGVVMEILEVKE